MLYRAIDSASSTCHSFEFDPWKHKVVQASPVITFLMACRGKVLLRRKTAENIRKRWFGADGVASLVIHETAPALPSPYQI